MIFGKEDLQSINPTRVAAQSAPLSIPAVCRKRQILSTTSRYLPPLTRTHPARKRHCIAEPLCSRAIDKQINRFGKSGV
jgi:hypothetical protein